MMLFPTEDEGMFVLMLGGQVDHAKCLADHEGLIKILRAKTGRDELVLDRVKWLAEYRPNIRMVNKFGDGRVFVAGGCKLRVQDAFNLGWKLAVVHKRLASPTLLLTYTEERLPDCSTGPWFAKNGSANDTSAWHRGSELGVNYRWSVVDELESYNAGDHQQPLDAYGSGGSSPAVHPGDRVADAPGLVVRGLSPTMHAVLVFTSNASRPAPFLEELKAYPPDTTRSVVIFPQDVSDVPDTAVGADMVLVDREGRAHEGYAVSGEKPMGVIVRPDHTIGGVMFGVEGIARYFGGIFASV
ncbi:hypothetical protein BKA93DRAFT_879252 [Sparassis latifolia]